MENTLLRNPHVGEILQYEFLEELDKNPDGPSI